MSSKTKTAKKKPTPKQGVQPKLRFPEFRNMGDWEEKALRELFSERQETGFISLPLLSLTEKEGVILQEGSNRKNNSNPNKSKYLRVCPGDIAYNTMRMWEGRSAIVSLEGLVSPAYTVCTPKKQAISEFFAYYFKTHSLIEQFYKYSQGLVKDTLNLKFPSFAQISVATSPIPAEQKKIADCLASIDELISVEAQKLDALKNYKISLMQLLFPAAGETVPNLRFPGFSGHWEYKVLSPYLEEYAERVSANTKLPIYSSTRVGLKPQKDYYDNREIINDGEYGVVPENYFVYRHMSDDGAFKFNINKTGFRIAVSKEYPVFRTVNLSAEFLLHKLNFGDDFKQFALEQKKGGTRTRLYFKTLCSWKTLLPSIAEQEKIAKFVATLDELITAQIQKVDAVKDHKTGLMQQLFPALSEAHA